MSNMENTNQNWPNSLPGPAVSMQANPGFQHYQSPPMSVGNSASVKSGPPAINGPMAVQPRPQMFLPTSNVNGVPQSPQGPSQQNGQFGSGIRPPGPSGVAVNGPNTRPPFPVNQPIPNTIPPGPFRPQNPNIAGPPIGGMPPSETSGGFRAAAPRMPPTSVSPGMASRPPSNITGPQGVSQGFGRPPSSQNSAFQPSDRPDELPVPFHGLGQYSHQVGMSLTPGTPVNSAPHSQKSSRTNSPSVNQNFDALEGQFRGTPEQENKAPWNSNQQVPNVKAAVSMQGVSSSISPVSSIQQPNMLTGSQTNTNAASLSGPQPGILTTNVQQPGFPGQPPAPGQTSGYGTPGVPRFPLPPSSAAEQLTGFVPNASQPQQRPGFPPMSTVNQRPGFQPHTGQPPNSMGVRPGFPPVSSAANQSGFPPTSMGTRLPPPPKIAANQGQGLPPPPSSSSQTPGFPSTAASQVPGFPPPPTSTNQVPGFPPAPTAPTNQVAGFPTAPPVSTNQMPGFPPPPTSTNQMPGFPPPPTSTNQMPGFPPPPTSTNQMPGFPPTSASSTNQIPGFPPQPTSGSQHQRFQSPSNVQGPQYNVQGQTIQDFVNTYPKPSTQMNAMTSNFNNMSMQGSQSLNLLQQKNLIPPDGVSTPKPVIPNDNRNVNCSPDVFRCTMNCIPQTSALLNKSRLPLGILIHPFRDLSQLPVIQSSVIVRCRSCRTYINPFVYFVDSRRWKCNLCYRVNELPEEFSYDPVSKSYGDPQRRPEIRSATIEFIAPSEYMLRPPQPAVYLYLLDVSFNAIETGYLTAFCETLLDVLDRIPGDSRTQIGFIAYDSSVHFFNLAEGLSQPQMLTVTDVDDIFLPCPDDLLVNLQECKSLVTDLLTRLPTLFENNVETRSALGAALQAAFKMTTATGGRISVMQTVLPTHGPGALQNREDSTQKTSKDVSSLGPATDFYKKLALDCSAQQIAVDLFMFNGQYADLASIECISKFSGGCVMYYPSYHAARSPHLVEKFETDLRRYLTRKIGFESVMRIRCSKGISIHTFHGNFFVRSTDLLSLPNVNPDAGFGMQMSIEEPLTDMSTMCFQAALLYTSSKGERRIRVHTLCLPVTNQLSDIHSGADQQAIVALLAKMAVDRCISSSMSDAREAIVNAAIDILNSYGSSLTSGQRSGSLCINEQLKLIPLYCLALLKSTAFRTGITTRLDDRSYAMHLCKTLPVSQLIQLLHPDLYPLHSIMDVEMVKKGQLEFPKLPLLQLSSAHIDRNGAYLLDTGDNMYIYIGSAINEKFLQDVLDVPNFQSIVEGGMTDLPELDNEGSERLRSFVTYLADNRSCGSAITIVREDGRLRMKFFQHFIEDRTESSISYIEFLQQIQVQVKS